MVGCGSCRAETWWSQIEAFLHTGVTDATSEGVDRVIKLEARNAYGFRNATNQRLQSRCAARRKAWRQTQAGQLQRSGMAARKLIFGP